MLDRADEEAIPRRGSTNGQTEQREIVGLRRSRCEDDLLRIRADQRPDSGSRFLHGARRMPADRMLGRVRVAKGVMPKRRHGLDRADFCFALVEV